MLLSNINGVQSELFSSTKLKMRASMRIEVSKKLNAIPGKTFLSKIELTLPHSQSMKQTSFAVLILCLIFSCSDKREPNKKPIVLGDPSSIVMESDSQYLKNYTEDISPIKNNKKGNQIHKMMVQVDSLNNAKKLNETPKTSQVDGFKIEFAECSVVLGGILCHALNNTQNERNENSVSYLRDAGSFLDNTLQVDGLTEMRMEQRLAVKLAIEAKGEQFILEDLGKFQTPWYPLAGKDKVFISVGSNSLQFKEVTQQSIKNALDRELRKKKKDRKEIQVWMDRIKNTNSPADVPCKLIAVSSQWRIWGKKDGKQVRKLIQLDMP
jgi:hypothetical protein